MRRLLFFPMAILALFPDQAMSEPQWTTGMTVGVSGEGSRSSFWKETSFHLGGRADVLFGRMSSHSYGVGPFGEILSSDFGQFQAGVGASFLLPVLEDFPMVISSGIYSSKLDGFQPGVSGQFFWGNRNYNYASTYGMTSGLFLQGRFGLGETQDSAILLGAQIDFMSLALPVLFIGSWIRGGSSDTKKIQ